MIAATRRAFMAGAASSGLVLSPRVARGQAKPRVVVVGGGIGGATFAKYLSMSVDEIDLTLVEPQRQYTSWVFGNLYLGGMRSIESLTYGYESLASRHGIKLVHDSAAMIEPEARRVRLSSGATLPYDRLVVSPGIAFVPNAIEGYGDAAAERMPHAWIGASQTRLLRAQLEAMTNGGVFVIAAPPDPIRCRAGPYERASLAAYYLKQFKPRSKVLILDAKDSFFAQDLFRDGWDRHYPGMIEWLPTTATGGITRVDPRTRSVVTAKGSFKADVANVIPPQTSGDIVRKSGLTDTSGWCPVDPSTFASTLHPGIHVIGDAAKAGEMPKSAFGSNSQAKACAFAIAAELRGAERPVPHLFDASFTFLAGNDVVSEVASFTCAQNIIKTGDIAMSRVEEPKELRRRTVQQAYGWYDAFMRDVFG